MRVAFLLLTVFIISSCQNDDKKSVEEKVFIVSKFNNDIEKRFEDARLDDPELSIIKQPKLYDYLKGVFNFIFFKDGSVLYHQEELFTIMCGNGLENLKPIKRQLSKDSLHRIQFKEILNFIKEKSENKELKNNWISLNHLSFSFENDTIGNLNIYKLLQDIDSLGFHSYTIRKIAPFESDAIGKIK